MERKYKSPRSVKAAGFFKRYIYFFITGGALMITALVLTLVFTLGGNTPVVTPPVDEPGDPVVVSNPVTFIVPVEGGVLAKGYSEDTLVFNATLKQWETHMALDYTAQSGAKVLAAYDGTVESVTDTILDDTVIVIAHKDDIRSVYKSLDSAVSVKEGDTVVTGQPIGTISASQIVEKSQGAHLHFEATVNGNIVDPSDYLLEK